MSRNIEYLFTPVPKDNMRKQFRSNLAKYENRVLRYIEYMLYDMGYKKDQIGIDQIARAVSITSRNASKIVFCLKSRHIITREGCITGFVEDKKEWNVTSTQKYIIDTSTEKSKGIYIEGLNTSTQRTISKSPKKIEKKKVFTKPGGKRITEKSKEILDSLIKGDFDMPGKKL